MSTGFNISVDGTTSNIVDISDLMADNNGGLSNFSVSTINTLGNFTFSSSVNAIKATESGSNPTKYTALITSLGGAYQYDSLNYDLFGGNLILGKFFIDSTSSSMATKTVTAPAWANSIRAIVIGGGGGGGGAGMTEYHDGKGGGGGGQGEMCIYDIQIYPSSTLSYYIGNGGKGGSGGDTTQNTGYTGNDGGTSAIDPGDGFGYRHAEGGKHGTGGHSGSSASGGNGGAGGSLFQNVNISFQEGFVGQSGFSNSSNRSGASGGTANSGGNANLDKMKYRLDNSPSSWIYGKGGKGGDGKKKEAPFYPPLKGGSGNSGSDGAIIIIYYQTVWPPDMIDLP